MRILMTALQPGGGIRTFFRYVYGHPVFSDYVFTLVAPDQGLSTFLKDSLPVDRIQMIPAETSKVSLIRQIRGVARKGTYDLIHSHGYSAGILTEISRTGISRPHLMTAHDVFLPVQFAGIKGALKQWSMAHLFKRMTGIHTVSDDARQNLIQFFPGISKSHIHNILHGIDTRYFSEGIPRALKEEISIPEQVPLIGFFGRFMGQKGFRILIDAMHRLVDGKLLDPLPHVVTFGWNGFIREDYSYLKEKGIGEYFHQLEETHDMPSAIKGVDLVAMPSRWEACGLLAMETLVAGVPIVGSDCIGLREVLAGSPARLFVTGNARELSKIIINEIDHLEERRNDFLKYQPQAVKRFDIERPVHELAALYNAISNTGVI